MTDAKINKRQALINSANMVKEARKLLDQGHFSGTKAARVVAVQGYLAELENHIRTQAHETKEDEK